MTSPPPPAGPPAPPPPPASQPSGGPGIAIRPLAAWALLGIAGAILLFGFISWIFPPARVGFVDRIGAPGFTGLWVLAAPVLAVLIATRAGPALPQSRLISLVALVEYLAALLLGGLAFLFTLAAHFDVANRGAFYAFGAIIQGFGSLIIELLQLALAALAGLWVYQTFLSLGGRLPRLNIRT